MLVVRRYLKVMKFTWLGKLPALFKWPFFPFITMQMYANAMVSKHNVDDLLIFIYLFT